MKENEGGDYVLIAQEESEHIFHEIKTERKRKKM